MSSTASALLFDAITRLKPVIGKGAARDARILLADTLGVEADRLTLVLPDAVSDQRAKRFNAAIAKRLQRQPVSQIIGKRLFWGREFLVTNDVLDPRPETETLIDLVLAGCPPKRILDLGLGTGCILLTLLAEIERATGVGTDISPEAIRIAQKNAARLGLTARAVFQKTSWFDGIIGKFDLIVSNPPYITAQEMQNLAPEVAHWEPEIALTPGKDGLAAYRAIAGGLDRYLAAEGRALFEIGSQQAKDVCAIFAVAGFTKSQVAQDMNGHDRIIQVQR